MSSFDARLTGEAEVQRRFEKVQHLFSDKEVKAVLRKGARIVRSVAKGEAPKGPTGNLRRSIRMSTLRGRPPAVRVGQHRARAPHFHLVALGTAVRSRRRVRTIFGVVDVGIGGATTGKMPANDFMGRAETRSRGAAMGVITAGFRALLDKVGK